MAHLGHLKAKVFGKDSSCGTPEEKPFSRNEAVSVNAKVASSLIVPFGGTWDWEGVVVIVKSFVWGGGRSDADSGKKWSRQRAKMRLY